MVIGNGTIDARLPDVTPIFTGNKVILKHNGSNLEIEVDEEIKAGGKYTAKEPFREKISAYSPMLDFGGGGYNSLMEILRLIDDRTRLKPVKDGSNDLKGRLDAVEKLSKDAFQPYYVDMSTPSLDLVTTTDSAKRVLWEKGVETLYLNGRPTPLNLVLNERADKIVIKSPLGNAYYTTEEIARVRDILKRSKGILANSLKDEVFANVISECSDGKTLVSVITGSLDAKTAYRKLVPNGVTIFNYDEFGWFMKEIGRNNYGSDADENMRIDYAIDSIETLRSNGMAKPIYVTLSKNGALCSDKSDIYHVLLKDDVSRKVQEAIEKQGKTTCGAGDCFGGAVFYFYMTHPNPNVTTAGMEGCRRAVKYLGYQGRINDNDFTVLPVSGIKKAA